MVSDNHNNYENNMFILCLIICNVLLSKIIEPFNEIWILPHPEEDPSLGQVKQLVQGHVGNYQPPARVSAPSARAVCTVRERNPCSQEADVRLECRAMFLVTMCRIYHPITM